MLTPAQKFKKLHDIDLDIMPIVEIAPHDREFVESDWRTAINSFCRRSHDRSVKKKFGLDLVTRVLGGKPAEVGSQFISNLSQNYRDELFDKVLRKFSPSKLAMGGLENEPVKVYERDVLFDFEYGCRDVWVSRAELQLLDPQQRSDYFQGGEGHATDETLPMMGRNVLVLDNGRKDGVTEALCKCFCELGASIVLTYVCDDQQKDGAVNAEQIAHNCRDMPGSIKIVEGIPYRSKIRSPQPPNVRYVEELIDKAAQILGETRLFIDCVGK